MPSLHNSYQHLIYRKWFCKLHINPVLSLRVSYFFHIFTLFAYCNKIYIKASISIYLVCLYALNLAACFAIVRAMVWSLFSVNDINSPHCSIESLITLSSIENGEKCQWCKWNTQLHKHPFIIFVCNQGMGERVILGLAKMIKQCTILAETLPLLNILFWICLMSCRETFCI